MLLEIKYTWILNVMVLNLKHSSKSLDTLHLLFPIRNSNHRCKYTLPCVALMLQTTYEYVCVFWWRFCHMSLKSSGKWVGTVWNCILLSKSAILKEKSIGTNFHFRHAFEYINFSKSGKLIFVHFILLKFLLIFSQLINVLKLSLCF